MVEGFLGSLFAAKRPGIWAQIYDKDSKALIADKETLQGLHCELY